MKLPSRLMRRPGEKKFTPTPAKIFAFEMNAITELVLEPEIEGFSLKANCPVVFVNCVIVPVSGEAVFLLKMKISGLKSAFAPVRLRVETKATRAALSLVEASRLSKATKGALVVVPGVGTRLAGVLVICVNSP